MNSPSSPIKLVFWNCASLAQRLKDGSIFALLNPDLTPDPPTILALVETTVGGPRPVSFRKSQDTHSLASVHVPNYTWAHRHHTGRSGGIAVLYHNSIACLNMTSAQHTERSAGRQQSCQSGGRPLAHYAIPTPSTLPAGRGILALRPTQHHSRESGGGARACAPHSGHARAHQLPVLLVGDFNLHHSDWEDIGEARRDSPAAA